MVAVQGTRSTGCMLRFCSTFCRQQCLAGSSSSNCSKWNQLLALNLASKPSLTFAHFLGENFEQHLRRSRRGQGPQLDALVPHLRCCREDKEGAGHLATGGDRAGRGWLLVGAHALILHKCAGLHPAYRLGAAILGHPRALAQRANLLGCAQGRR